MIASAPPGHGHPSSTAGRAVLSGGYSSGSGAPAREAVLEAVPAGDLRLADPPAEEHVAVAGPRDGKSTRPVVEVLDERAELVDRGDAAGDAPRLLVDAARCSAAAAVVSIPPPLPATGAQQLVRARLHERAARGGASTISSASGRTVSSASFASSSVKTRLTGGGSRRARGYDRRVVGAGQRLRAPRAAGRAPSRPAWARNPVPELFLWSRARDLGRRALRAPRRSSRTGTRGPGPGTARVYHDLGYAHRRLGALGQRLVPPHRRARLPRAAPRRPSTRSTRRCSPCSGAPSAATTSLAGIALSLAACFGSFLLLYRLAEERLGADGARRAVLYLAFFPMALFLQAVYTRVALPPAHARRLPARRAAAAGSRPALVAGLALLTRPAAVALLPPLVLLAWRSPQRRRARRAGSPLAPALFAVFPLVLWQQTGDPWAFARSQELWHRHLSPAGPARRDLGRAARRLGRRRAARVRLAHAPLLARGRRAALGPDADRGDQPRVPRLPRALRRADRRRLAALRRALRAVRGAQPRDPALACPASGWPLLSIPRFGLGVFPLFLALAVARRAGRACTSRSSSVSSMLLGVAIVQWSLWQWVA